MGTSTLSGIDNPIGVAEYQLVCALPEPLVTSLPTVEQLESELGTIEDAPSHELGDRE